MRRVALACVALPLALVACKNEREESLRAEIAKTKEERVERATIEEARGDADRAAEQVAALRAELDAERARIGARETERDRLRAAVDAESARASRLLGEAADAGARAQEFAQRGAALDAEIERERMRAVAVRDQAAAFAREIRPGDAAWASERRIEAFADFAARVARAYPGDAELVALAAESAPDGGVEIAIADRAARVRDRIATVYELEAPSAPDEASP